MRMNRRWAKRLVVMLTVLAMTVPAGNVLAVPASAQQVQTTTFSFVNSLGHTVTIESTFVNGVLTMRHLQEVVPPRALVLDRTVRYWPTGHPQTSVERGGLTGPAPYAIRRTFDQSGILRTQYAELVIKGQVAVQSWTTFDASGILVSKEERVLKTLGDGAKIWKVTVEHWSASVLVSRIVRELPLGTVSATGGSARP